MSRVDREAEELLDQQAQTFIEENKELLEDPETSSDVLGRVFEHGTKIIQELGQAYQDAVKEELPLSKRYNEAQIDDSLSPKELQKRELPYKSAKKKSAERLAAFERFKVFTDKVRECQEAKRDQEWVEEQHCERTNYEVVQAYEDALRDEHAVRSAKGTPKKLPWWKRLLGVHQETSSEAREWPTTPSQAISEREDYEKLLTWYEQNLEVLERAVAGRQSGEPGDWKFVIDHLLGRIGWCDRHMDTIEGRNADMAAGELVERREGLASRRAELGE